MNESDESTPNYRLVGFAAAWAAGLTMIGLIVGGGVEQLADAVTAATNVALADRPDAAKGQAAKGIDYSATGAIKGATPLNPCQR
jgi:hypothetical protein